MTAPPLIGPITVREYGPRTIPPYLGNGLVGLRIGALPWREGVCIPSGLAGTDPVERVEGFARGPFPLAGDLSLDGVRLGDQPERAQLVEQTYDIRAGELTTRFRFAPERVAATVTVTTLLSRTLPTIALQEIVVEVDGDCRLEVSAGVDPTGIGGRLLERETETPGMGQKAADGTMLWETHGGLTTCGLAYSTECAGAGRLPPNQDQTAPLLTAYAADGHPGHRVRLRQLASVIASQFSREPHRQATRMVSVARLRGWDLIRAENRRAWEQLWRARPLLHGADEEWQRMADAAYYYLHASAHDGSLFSTSMFGLAYWPNYHYYRGQVMWDIEAFGFPPLLLTAPSAAAALLDYRSRNLNAARLNAALNGYDGIQFPWAAGPLSGEEVLRTSAPVVTVEQHVNMAVAHAFMQYVDVTGDADYLEETAWPVLEGVANWIGSRCVETERGFEIRQTLGFAEGRPDQVDNDAYVNMTAAVALRQAAAAAERLGRPDGGRWRHIADRLFLAVKEGVVLNHDRFTPEEPPPAGATPEALAGLYPFGFELPAEQFEKTVRFYLGRVDPYLGSPMFSAPLAVFAARLGDRAGALDYLVKGYAEFVNQPWLDANEFSTVRHPEKPVVGPFMANAGGFLQALYLGFPNLRPGPDEPAGWARGPVVLPAGWEAIEVERLWVRGREARLLARQGAERAELEVRDAGFPMIPGPRPDAG